MSNELDTSVIGAMALIITNELAFGTNKAGIMVATDSHQSLSAIFDKVREILKTTELYGVVVRDTKNPQQISFEYGDQVNGYAFDEEKRDPGMALCGQSAGMVLIYGADKISDGTCNAILPMCHPGASSKVKEVKVLVHPASYTERYRPSS